MDIEECPFCGKDIDMDEVMTDYIIDGGSGPHDLDCPHCEKIMRVEVDWEPVYYVQTLPKPKKD